MSLQTEPTRSVIHERTTGRVFEIEAKGMFFVSVPSNGSQVCCGWVGRFSKPEAAAALAVLVRNVRALDPNVLLDALLIERAARLQEVACLYERRESWARRAWRRIRQALRSL